VLNPHLAVENQRAVQPCSLDVAKELAKISLLRLSEVSGATRHCAILEKLDQRTQTCYPVAKPAQATCCQAKLHSFVHLQP